MAARSVAASAGTRTTQRNFKRSADAANAADRARDLAWHGDHAAAIDTCTRALHGPGTSTSPGARIELLDLRAESYIAIGELKRAAADADAMAVLAARGRSSALSAQVHAR